MLTLDLAIANQKYRISQLHCEQEGGVDQERMRQLFELGFIKGESVMLLRRTMPGSDPMVVRIGTSTFALRKAEARTVRVEKVSSQ
jgi:ferrous iron transport protein A